METMALIVVSSMMCRHVDLSVPVECRPPPNIDITCIEKSVLLEERVVGGKRPSIAEMKAKMYVHCIMFLTVLYMFVCL